MAVRISSQELGDLKQGSALHHFFKRAILHPNWSAILIQYSASLPDILSANSHSPRHFLSTFRSHLSLSLDGQLRPTPSKLISQIPILVAPKTVQVIRSPAYSASGCALPRPSHSIGTCSQLNNTTTLRKAHHRYTLSDPIPFLHFLPPFQTVARRTRSPRLSALLSLGISNPIHPRQMYHKHRTRKRVQITRLGPFQTRRDTYSVIQYQIPRDKEDPLMLVQTGCSARLGALHISQMRIGVTPLAVESPPLQYSHPDDTGNPGIAMQGLRAITPHAKSLNQHQPWRSEYRQFSTRHKHRLPDQIQGSRGKQNKQ